MAEIYALVSSSAPSIYRYVGKTVKTSAMRLKSHMSRYLRGEETNRHKAHWFSSVLSEGGTIEAVVLDVCPDANQDEREVHWIRKCREEGHPLTNLSDGGEGGFNPDPLVREKIGAAHRGRRHTSEAKARMSAAAKKRDLSGARNPNYGKTHTEEAKQRIIAKRKGIPLSASHRQKLSEVGKGVNSGVKNGSAKRTPEEIEAIYKRIKLGGEHYESVMREYEMHPMTWYKIASGSKWAHLNLKERFAPCS